MFRPVFGGAVISAALAFSGFAGVSYAQTFSANTIDTSGLADLAQSGCLERSALATHACEAVAAMVAAIRPPPAGDKAVVSADAVMQLCADHNLRDVVCGEAALLELRYAKVPCWDTNKC